MSRKEIIEMILEDFSEVSSSSSSSDSEDYMTTSSSSSDEAGLYADLLRQDHSKVNSFLDVVDSYNDNDFKSHFRLRRTTVDVLIGMYNSADVLPCHSHGGCEKMGAKKEMLMFLWYVGNTITFRQLGNLFGVCKSSSWQAVIRVCSWFVGISDNYVKWPRGQQANEVMVAFERMKGIPGVLGAIDGTLIKIKAPRENAEKYFNRKKYYSLAVQAVVNADKKIIDLYCGEPGSLHDSRMLRRSPLYAVAEQNESSLFPENSFIIGDSAYRQKNWLVPPFRDNGHLTRQQIRFNVIHSSTRMVVENAFGILKTRFRRLLHFTEHSNLDFIVKIIIACCVLHNICIDEGDIHSHDENDNDNAEDGTTGTLDVSQEQESGSQKRQQVFNFLIEKGLI